MHLTRLTAAVVVAALLPARPAAAQDVREMTFVTPEGQDQLAVTVQYQDPAALHNALRDTHVLPVRFELKNTAAHRVPFDWRDLRLNVGGSLPLPAGAPSAALRDIQRSRNVPAFVSFLGGRSEAFHPNQVAAWLSRQQLKDGDLAPGETRTGLVFFICPGGLTREHANGVLVLEAAGRPPQLLETKGITVRTKAPQQQGFAAMLKQTITRYFGSAPPAYDKSYALLIGIGKYRYWPALESPLQDVRKMEAYLAAQGFDEIVTITDEAVTPEAFSQPQRYFKSKLRAEDRFLFYYSGHGDTVQEGNVTRGYFPLIDARPGSTARSIAMTDVVAWTRALPSRHLLVILDSCFSGLAVPGTELKGEAPSAAQPDPDTINRIARGPARYLMMAGTAGQRSFGGQQWNGSVFTDTLLKGARSGADVYHNRIVTTRALYVWLKEAIYVETLKAHRELTPLFLDLGPASEGEFIFVSEGR